jgi:hypothetical protein
MNLVTGTELKLVTGTQSNLVSDTDLNMGTGTIRNFVPVPILILPILILPPILVYLSPACSPAIIYAILYL